MNVYEATTLARAYSKEGKTFRLEFYGYDEDRDRFTGVKVINQCLVRPGNPKDRNDDYKLQLFDVGRDENKSCWIPCLKSINGTKVITP